MISSPGIVLRQILFVLTLTIALPASADDCTFVESIVDLTVNEMVALSGQGLPGATSCAEIERGMRCTYIYEGTSEARSELSSIKDGLKSCLSEFGYGFAESPAGALLTDDRTVLGSGRCAGFRLTSAGDQVSVYVYAKKNSDSSCVKLETAYFPYRFDRIDSRGPIRG